MNELASPDRREQEHHADDGTFHDFSGSDPAKVATHEHGDGDGSGDGENAPGTFG